MNIRDFQYLVAVHDLKSFSRAAERCFVSQPTLSGQLKKLEEFLGITLIERSTRQMIFTEEGEEVVRQAREVLATVESIREYARTANDPMSGRLKIGFLPTIGPYLLPNLMPLVTKNYPKLELFLYELQTDVLLEKLQQGEVDAAVLAKLGWKLPLQEVKLFDENMKLAVSENDALSGRVRPVPHTIMEGRSVLMLEDGHCLRDQAMGFCFSAGAKEDSRFQATSVDTLLHMVAAGTGMTLVPEMAAQQQVDGVKFLSFSKPEPSREIVMLMRKNHARPEVLDAVAQLIKQAQPG